MKRARTITDRGQQRDFLRACVEQITLAGDEVNVRFSLNLPAAVAALGDAPDGTFGPAAGATNCKLSQRAVLDRSAHGGRQSRFVAQRDEAQPDRLDIRDSSGRRHRCIRETLARLP
jgi:hypothetical protein